MKIIIHISLFLFLTFSWVVSAVPVKERDISTPNFQKFIDDPSLINKWFRYADDNAYIYFESGVTKHGFLELGEDGMIIFSKQYGDAPLSVIQKLRLNPRLIKHWDECHVDFLIYRSDIRFLEELHHFKVKDPNAFDHLAFLRSRPKSGGNIYHATGGHTEDIILDGTSSHFVTSNGLEILDPFFTHAIDPTNTSARMLNYLQNSKNNTNILTSVGINNKLFKYEVNTLASGHKEHRQLLFLMDPQPSTFNANQLVLNGQVYELPKPTHTQYKASWTEQKLKEEMAFALANKKLDGSKLPEINPPRYGQTQQHVTTYWDTEFSDGTPLGLITSNYAKDPVTNTIKYDHLSLLFIK